MIVRFFTILTLAALPLGLGSCDRNPGPGLEIHDTKYAAIGVNGEMVDVTVETWACVLDQYTGLMWEVKAATPGPHDWRNTYSWYAPKEAQQEGLDYRGTPRGGQCIGSDCDTWAYVQAVNQAGYCGHHDWRLPSRDELASISDLRKVQSPPTINKQYFPYTQPDEYWSSNDYSFRWDAAWAWNYRYGHDRVDWKKSPKRVRLVRGEALVLERVED